MSDTRMIDLCSVDDVSPGCAFKVEVEGLILAAFNIEGEYFVTDDTCTHGPGSLSEGFIEGDIVECEVHNGAFNIRTGEVAAPPCMSPLKTYPVVVRDGRICIAL